jgi:hypothetical protein
VGLYSLLIEMVGILLTVENLSTVPAVFDKHSITSYNIIKIQKCTALILGEDSWFPYDWTTILIVVHQCVCFEVILP